MKMMDEIICSYLRIRSSKLTCSVSDIAKEVGLSKSSLYYYFSSMEELEEKSVSYCMKILSENEIKVDFSSRTLSALICNLLLGVADVFSSAPLCWFFSCVWQRRGISSTYADISHKISMMICARLRVALEYAVQESMTDLRDTDGSASVITSAFLEVLSGVNLSDGVPEDNILELCGNFVSLLEYSNERSVEK